MKLKALIVDDERLARKELRSLLVEFSEIEILGEAENVSQALRVIESETPQVVFLDIQLAGETGFDLLEKVGAADFKTVFVTAFDAYAIRAFEVNALDYLLKPVNPERLKKQSKNCRTMNKRRPTNFARSPLTTVCFWKSAGARFF